MLREISLRKFLPLRVRSQLLTQPSRVQFAKQCAACKFDWSSSFYRAFRCLQVVVLAAMAQPDWPRTGFPDQQFGGLGQTAGGQLACRFPQVVRIPHWQAGRQKRLAAFEWGR